MSYYRSSEIEEINCTHDRLIIRCLQLSLFAMERQGMGIPPVPYALLLFGSGGRREQSLTSDQDHGLVYALPSGLDDVQAVRIHRFFADLADILVAGLAEAGYPPCIGNVISSNPRWRLSLDQWKQQIDMWHDDPTWEHVRYLLMVADARMIYGDPKLFEEFTDHFHRCLLQQPPIIDRLVSNTLHHRVPLGMFGHIYKEAHGVYPGAINIKNGLYLPFVNCIRLLSLINGSYATSTIDRLHYLREQQLLPEALCRDVELYFRFALGLRILACNQWHDNRYLSNSYLKAESLSKDTLHMLRQAMRMAILLQKKTAQQSLCSPMTKPYEKRVNG
ncbi:MAG: DUF294 nucleotidyltransferase-like domain-containing protein [Clostridia bacterium]